MNNKVAFILITLIFAILIIGCTSLKTRSLASFQELADCYDRQQEPFTFAVDAHIHFRPFGGSAIPFSELNDYFNKSGVRFVNIFGIGQMFSANSPCTYYLDPDCREKPITPTIRNDFVNAANYVEFKPREVNMILSITFPDLSNPENIVDIILLYDKEYPGMFKWAGELNIVKQAIFENHHRPVTTTEIDRWEEFMRLLKERNIPVTFHSDLGNNDEPTKYLHLMEYVLQRYPDNKIVWAHMGLSRELSKMDPKTHIQIMKSLLNKSPNLMLDVSWRVLYDEYFQYPDIMSLFIAFFNEHSDRILPGTDFVASRDKDFKVYQEELEVNSRIFKYVNDEAFRNIVLGDNYFRLLGINYQAPRICPK